MITWNDLYNVLTAVVPLYVAMMLAYGSVRWWKIFTPDQCSGINRFVAVFAVPLLSFHFISTNDPYTMNLRFIAADTLQKVATLFVLAAWTKLISDRTDTVEWMITIFSLSTLPNTLVMGIPLLVAMYGPYSGNLMVQVVVLQCIVWYTLLLFLFEYRGARMLIMEQFPETAGSIVSFKVDTDVVSLVDGKDTLQADAAITGDGKVHVTVRKSNASRQSLPRSSFSALITPRPSNLTGAEIYSLSSSRNPTPRSSNFNNPGGYSFAGGPGIPARHSSFDDISAATETVNPKSTQSRAIHDAKELHMFFWNNTASPVPDIASPEPGHPGPRCSGHGPRELRMFVADLPRNGEKKTVADGEVGAEKIRFEGGRVDAEERERGRPESTGLSKEVIRSAELHPKAAAEGGSGKQMPPARVMTRLILIMVWRKLIRNPNTYSSLLGLLWSLVAFRCHLSMPDIIEKSISILSNAGLGMAMFSLGLFMALQPKIIACGNSVASFAMAIRFIVGPAIMAAASIVVGVRGTLLRIAIVQAALPQGIVPFVFAKEYNVYPAILSTAVIFGMLIALPITLVYYILLGL